MTQQPVDYPPFKQVFLYDPETGVFAGTYEAQLSPLDAPGTYLEPVCSTDVVPLIAAANQVAVFAAGAWTLEPDFRGQTWYDQTTGAAVEITAVGQPASNLAVTPPPPTLAQQWTSYQASVKMALASTDTTVARISEAISLGSTTATTADVVAYMSYRKSLRAILSEVQQTTIPTALPTKAPYPANT